MTDKIRWGVVSTANIGRKRVIPAIHASSNGQVIAVSSRSQENADAMAAELGIPQAFGSYEALIRSGEVDAIYNPLPNSQHAEWSIRCAEAGIPTLCEKPLACDSDEAQRMVDAFKARDILFAEAFMYRFHPQSQRVKALLDEGAIGEIRAMQATFTFVINDERNIRLSKSLAGGSLMDVGCYCVNAMRFMTGEEPAEVKAIAHIGETTQVEEALSGVLSFPGGAIGHFDSGLRTYRAHHYEIRGTQGRIQVSEGFVMTAESDTLIRIWQDDGYQEIVIPAANSYIHMVEDFAAALMDNRSPRFDPQDGVENMRVIDRLHASAGVSR